MSTRKKNDIAVVNTNVSVISCEAFSVVIKLEFRVFGNYKSTCPSSFIFRLGKTPRFCKSSFCAPVICHRTDEIHVVCVEKFVNNKRFKLVVINIEVLVTNVTVIVTESTVCFISCGNFIDPFAILVFTINFFNCATGRALLGSYTCRSAPFMVSIAAECFFAVRSITDVIFIFIKVIELGKNFCLCMCFVVCASICLNAVCCTSCGSCYYAIVISVLCSINRDFFCLCMTACASVEHFTNCRAGRLESYFAVIILMTAFGCVCAPCTGTLIPSAFSNCVKVCAVGRKNKVGCLIPLVRAVFTPNVFGIIGIHTNKDDIVISNRDNCCISLTIAGLCHAYPCISVCTEHINCKSCVSLCPVRVRNKVNSHFLFTLEHCNSICFLIVTNRAFTCLYTCCNVCRSCCYCPITPCVISKLTTCFVTSSTS